jgi:hypothetical protein
MRQGFIIEPRASAQGFECSFAPWREINFSQRREGRTEEVYAARFKDRVNAGRRSTAM